MINKTRDCLRAKGITTPISEDRFSEALTCETAIFSKENDYTYHTHPNGSPKPSQTDKDTTNKFNKKFMFIGLVPTREVVVYGADDNFTNMLGGFSI